MSRTPVFDLFYKEAVAALNNGSFSVSPNPTFGSRKTTPFLPAETTYDPNKPSTNSLTKPMALGPAGGPGHFRSSVPPGFQGRVYNVNGVRTAYPEGVSSHSVGADGHAASLGYTAQPNPNLPQTAVAQSPAPTNPAGASASSPPAAPSHVAGGPAAPSQPVAAAQAPAAAQPASSSPDPGQSWPNYRGDLLKRMATLGRLPGQKEQFNNWLGQQGPEFEQARSEAGRLGVSPDEFNMLAHAGSMRSPRALETINALMPHLSGGQETARRVFPFMFPGQAAPAEAAQQEPSQVPWRQVLNSFEKHPPSPEMIKVARDLCS